MIMRKICFAVSFLFVCVCAGAQGHKQLDSLRYILPEFSEGTVMYADKQFSRGMLNISPLDQAVYCLSPENDTLYVAANADILRISVAGRSFTKWKDSFVEMAVMDGNMGVGIIRSTAKVSNVKTGAYGSSTTTSSIRSYSVDAATGTLTNLIIEDPRNYVYTRTACLFVDGKYLPVSRKSYEKMFPEKKDYIESVWPERNIKPTDFDAAVSFFKDLLQN